MVWNSLWPDGSQSVKQNTVPGQQNTTYIESTLGNLTNNTKDHFWNIGTDEDGHHRAVQMMDYADTFVGAPVSPLLTSGMDLAIFARLKTIAESPANQSVQPFARNAGAIMQILGIRACAVIKVVPPGGVFTTTYSHNATVVRDASGKFHIHFTAPLPSDAYLAVGGCIFATATASSGFISTKPTSNSSGSDVKTVNDYYFYTMTSDTNITDPIQAWVVVFGG